MSPHMKQTTKGFTLIELIVTIAILAVLVGIVVVAINPAEQLQRARDTKRVSDLDALVSAFNLYMAQATATINLTADATANARCTNGAGVSTIFASAANTLATTTGFTATTATTLQTVGASTAWAPARLDQTPGGSPIAVLPLDPTNNSSFFYLYVCDAADKRYEFTARLESSYFKDELDLDGKDGGNSATTYEVGSKVTIIGSGY